MFKEMLDMNSKMRGKLVSKVISTKRIAFNYNSRRAPRIFHLNIHNLQLPQPKMLPKELLARMSPPHMMLPQIMALPTTKGYHMIRLDSKQLPWEA